MSHEFAEKKIYLYSTVHRLSNQDEISARSIVLLCQSCEIQSFTDWVVQTAEIHFLTILEVENLIPRKFVLKSSP